MRSQWMVLGLVATLVGFGARTPATVETAPMSADARITVPAEAAVAGPTAIEALVENAVDAFSSEATRLSDSNALRLAFQAYYNYKAAHSEKVRKPYLYFVDYGLDNRTPRGYVFDMQKLELIEGPFVVAHGRGSSNGKNGVPTRFSNRSGSASTSLGLYVAAETYGFSGKAGGQHYTSIGLRMDGVSGQFNSKARARGVVAHGAPYVTPSGSGRSEGCPAMEQSRARRLIPKIANGGLIFLYSPRDASWLEQDPWVNGTEGS